MLRDSRKGTPHQIINARQREREAKRATSTYDKEREWLKEDMEAAGVPTKEANELLAKSDEYFERLYNDALPTHSEKGLETWFGAWKPNTRRKAK